MLHYAGTAETCATIVRTFQTASRYLHPAPEAPGQPTEHFMVSDISFGKTGSFTKFPLFLSKKIGGVNTGGNGGRANFLRSRALTAVAGAVYDQGKPWQPGDRHGSPLRSEVDESP